MSEGNPFGQLAAAARGDLITQRAFADSAMRRFYDANGNPLDPDRFDLADAAALIEGLVFARMAAANGDDEDRNRLLGMLSLGALLPPECALAIVAERIARASLLIAQTAIADDDAEAVDLLVNQFAKHASPEAVACSHLYRQLIIESETA